MTSTLPKRSFVALPPPPEGLEGVRREAARRRRRKLAAAAGGGAGALAVAVAVLLSGGGGGVAVLQPEPPATQPGQVTTPTPPASSRVDGRSQARGAGPAAVAGRRAGRAPAPRSGVVVARVPTATDATPPRPVGGPAQPRLERWQSTYVPPPGAARVCGGSTSSDSGGVGAGVGWCLTATTRQIDGGVRLQIQACRDDTSGGTLSYQTAREVDLTVKRGSATVWDWGRDHPDRPGTHQLTAAADGCWNWAVDWPAVTQTGGSAGHGTFTFVGTAMASELSGFPPQTVSFSY
jgi:hypothetical protein